MKKPGKIVKISIIALSLTAIWIFFAPFLAKNLIVEKPLESADAIVVLSGSKAFVERTQTAAELYNKHISKKILLTDDGGRGSWNQAEQTNLRYSELAKRELIKQGVSAQDIEILEPQVSGTIYEAEVLKNHIENHNLKNILLVTSVYHTSRTLWTFEREMKRNNLQINFGIEHAPFNKQNPVPESWWLSFFGWRVVAGEYVKILVYWIFY